MMKYNFKLSLTAVALNLFLTRVYRLYRLIKNIFNATCPLFDYCYATRKLPVLVTFNDRLYFM